MAKTTEKAAANRNKNVQTAASACAGLIGSSVGKVILHPIDTIKAKLQVQQMSKQQVNRGQVIQQIVRDTIRSEGMGGLYRGFAIHISGSIPAAALYFGSYEFFKSRVLDHQFFQDKPFLAYLSGGMFAEAIACSIFVPVDVIKERRQVQANLGTFKYKNDLDAIRQILKTEGVRGMYRAYGATVMSFGPFSALYFLFYEKLKEKVANFTADDYRKKMSQSDQEGRKAAHSQDIGFFQAMLCSMQAGVFASLITNPLDMAKLRLQVQRAGQAGGGDKSQFYYKHMLHGIYRIALDEGPLALFAGSFARCLFHVPMVAISMSIVEVVKPKAVTLIESASSSKID